MAMIVRNLNPDGKPLHDTSGIEQRMQALEREFRELKQLVMQQTLALDSASQQLRQPPETVSDRLNG